MTGTVQRYRLILWPFWVPTAHLFYLRKKPLPKIRHIVPEVYVLFLLGYYHVLSDTQFQEDDFQVWGWRDRKYSTCYFCKVHVNQIILSYLLHTDILFLFKQIDQGYSGSQWRLVLGEHRDQARRLVSTVSISVEVWNFAVRVLSSLYWLSSVWLIFFRRVMSSEDDLVPTQRVSSPAAMHSSITIPVRGTRGIKTPVQPQVEVVVPQAPRLLCSL